MDQVFVASRLEKGARILGEGTRFMYVEVDRDAFRHLGKVAAGGRKSLSFRPSLPV
jgi:glutamyl-tRNA reductase